MIAPRISLSPAMKMAELLDTHVALPGVFNRMGLPYGFGEASVEEVCQKADIDARAFLLICKIYALEGYRPAAEELQSARLQDIVRYLRFSHRYYLETALPTLADAMERMSRPCQPRSREIIRRFFHDYRSELSRHFDYEEEKVFPFVEAYLAGDGEKPFMADEFSETHESAEEKLEDLKSLVVKYLPAECDLPYLQLAVFYIYSLGVDVRKHILLEDLLLAPMLPPKERTVLESRLEDSDASPLSQREKEILVSVARGMLNKEIADQYNLSIHTVITHRKNITRKTGIKTVAGLTVYALLNNLIDMNTVE